MMSFIGMLLGIVVFVLFAYLGYNRILMAFIGAAIMFLFSGMSILDGYTTSFLPAMGSYVQKYALIFILSALLGKIMTETGTAKSIALTVSRYIRSVKNDKLQVYLCVLFVPVLYFILMYIGINGMVIAFTVMPIAKDLFAETNTPWRIYTCAGAQAVNAAMLSGSLSSTSVTSAEVCGVSVSAGAGVSLVLVGVFSLVTAVMLAFVAAKIYKTKEGFLPSGEAIAAAQLAQGISENDLPPFLLSLLPILAVIVLSAAFRVNVVVALTAGCLITLAVGWKNIRKNLKPALAAGVVSSYAPLLSVSATVGFGAALKALQGFSVVDGAFSNLPPLYNALSIGFFGGFVTANATTPAASFGTQIISLCAEAGLTIATTEKLMCWLCCASMAPHNAGFANVEAVMRLPYKEGLKNYTLFTFIPAFISLAVVIVLINLGVIV